MNFVRMMFNSDPSCSWNSRRFLYRIKFFFFFLSDERDRDVIEDIIENGTALEEVDEDKDEDENEDEDAEETTVSTIPLVKMGKMIQ